MNTDKLSTIGTIAVTAVLLAAVCSLAGCTAPNPEFGDDPEPCGSTGLPEGLDDESGSEPEPKPEEACADETTVTFTIETDDAGKPSVMPNYCAAFHASCFVHGSGTVGLECEWYACNASSRIDYIEPTRPNRVFTVGLESPCD